MKRVALLLFLVACQTPTETRQTCEPVFTPAVNAQGDTVALIGTCGVVR